MPHKFDPKKMHHLDGDERRKRIDPEAVLSSLPLLPDQVVADIGCGTGFFSVPISQRLPRGKVYALDIADEMIERLVQKVQQKGIGNIEVLKTGEMDFPIGSGAVDGAFLSFVLHEQDDRIEFLNRVREILKPGGWLAVVEWQKKASDFGPPLEERIGQAELREIAAEAGFSTSEVKELGEFNYMAVFQAGAAPV